MKLRTLEELLSSKTIEAEKAERRRKEETALLEAKFEEERKAFNKLLRKAAREGQLALGDPSSPEDNKITAVAPIRVQSRDWVVLHRGDDVRSSFGGEFEKELTNRLITRLRPPVYPVGEIPASDGEVLFPSHLIGTALSRMLDLGMEPNFQSLLVAVLRALNTLLQVGFFFFFFLPFFVVFVGPQCCHILFLVAKERRQGGPVLLAWEHH